MTVDVAAITAEVRGILAQADAEIARRRPVCQASGRCCRFEEYGHRMYVTAAEVVHFSQVAGARPDERAGEPAGGKSVSLPLFFAGKAEGCPYQVEGLCTAREARPLGCRVYFCDENAQAWQNELYEMFHQKLKAVHERHGLPYAYLEWRAALKGMMEAEAGTGR